MIGKVSLMQMEFINDFANKGGVSFAFMNLSKFSNESGKWKADVKLIDEFVRLRQQANENFWSSEINLLNPDVIIGMNFGSMAKCLGSFSKRIDDGSNNDARLYHLETQKGKKYIYVDTWHFSALRKSPERDIFNPIMKALKDQSLI